MKIKIQPFLVFPFLVLSACASKQDLLVVRDDLQKLKTDSETVKTQSAGSYSDVQQVRDEVARLQGSIDELAHSNSQTFGRLGMEDSLMVHKVDDLESRLQKIEQILQGKQEPQPASLPPQPPETAQKLQKAQSAYQPGDSALLKEGEERFGKSDYTGARESFSVLLKSYPKSLLAADAQFKLAESYFIEKWYEKAALEYQVVIAKYPKSARRPAALYKQALSFEKIGDTANAKARFRSLVNLYPSAPEAKLARKKLP